MTSADAVPTVPPPPAPALVAVERVRRAIQLRTTPKREITPATLADDLDDYRRGCLRVTRLWEDIIEEDDALATVVSKRLDAAARLRWEILIDEDTADGKTAEAERHKEVLQGFYSGVEVVNILAQDERGGVGHLARLLLGAKAHGLAALEWIWKPASSLRSYTTAEFRRCPTWWFESRTGRTRYLVNDWDMWGIELDPRGWLIAGAPALMKASSILWLYRNLSLRDWLAFSEKYGMPGLIGETTADKGTPAWDEFKAALGQFGPDFALVVNEGAKITPITVATSGTLPYQPLIEMLTRATYALWLGGDLSTLSAQTGQGQGASLQGGEAAKIEDDDARFVSETLQARVDRHVIAYHFGEGVQPLAYFRLCPPARQNVLQDLDVDRWFAERGLAQDRAAVYARYGRPLPDAGADVVFDQPSPSGNPFDLAGPLANAVADPAAFAAASKDRLAKAIAADLAPVRARLERILKIEDPAILNERLTAFRAELPALLRDIIADPAAAAEFERVIAAGMIRGLTSPTGRPTPKPRTA